MKKLTIRILVLTFLFCIIFTGCKNSEDKDLSQNTEIIVSANDIDASNSLSQNESSTDDSVTSNDISPYPVPVTEEHLAKLQKALVDYISSMQLVDGSAFGFDKVILHNGCYYYYSFNNITDLNQDDIEFYVDKNSYKNDIMEEHYGEVFDVRIKSGGFDEKIGRVSVISELPFETPFELYFLSEDTPDLEARTGDSTGYFIIKKFDADNHTVEMEKVDAADGDEGGTYTVSVNTGQPTLTYSIDKNATFSGWDSTNSGIGFYTEDAYFDYLLRSNSSAFVTCNLKDGKIVSIDDILNP